MLRLVFNRRIYILEQAVAQSTVQLWATWVWTYLDASELRCYGFNQKASMGQTQDMLGRKSLSASWEHFGVALEVLEVVALDGEASASLVGLLSWISSRKLTGWG